MKQGPRKPNLYPNAKMIYVIDEVGKDRQILQPKEFKSKLRNVIRALIRDKLNPSIYNWHDYREYTKEELCKEHPLVNFRNPVAKQALVRRRAMKMMGESF